MQCYCVASTTEDDDIYESYVRRFHDIYPEMEGIRYFYISGDNDVGGEGYDKVTRMKIDRFRQNFGSGQALKAENGLEFVHFDYLQSKIWSHNQIEMKIEEIERSDRGQFRILISHIPFTMNDNE